MCLIFPRKKFRIENWWTKNERRLLHDVVDEQMEERIHVEARAQPLFWCYLVNSFTEETLRARDMQNNVTNAWF